MKEMVRRKKYPHMLLFGPPGSGKSTTAISLVKEAHPDIPPAMSCLHLNASDERGLETIRTRIADFVSASMFVQVTPKFVILDEAENMTEQAQLSLRTFLDADGTSLNKQVCFMFLANHLTKIHPDLLSRFVRFRLAFLPRDIMVARLQHIARAEGYTLTQQQAEMNLTLYRSDMRHQIQHLQQICAHPTEVKSIERFVKFVRGDGADRRQPVAEGRGDVSFAQLQNQVAIYLEQYEVSNFLTCLLVYFQGTANAATVLPMFVRNVVEFRAHSGNLSHDAMTGWLARIIREAFRAPVA